MTDSPPPPTNLIAYLLTTMYLDCKLPAEGIPSVTKHQVKYRV